MLITLSSQYGSELAGEEAILCWEAQQVVQIDLAGNYIFRISPQAHLHNCKCWQKLQFSSRWGMKNQLSPIPSFLYNTHTYA